MSDIKLFQSTIETGYTFKGPTITIGGSMLDGKVVPGSYVKLPLSTMNRHGLIAGATGTGKTKSLQKIAEQLSLSGVPCLVMDIKGDVSGVSQAGITNEKISTRQTTLSLPWEGKKLPVEFLTISSQNGSRMRATVSEFGPVLFSKILDLNDTQSSVVSLAFKYCDDNKIPLLDLADFKKTVQYLSNEGKEEIEKEYGSISTTSVGTITRKIIELEQQGGEILFGERSFEVSDLLRTDSSGKGYISVVRLNDMQDKPKLFSTFMLTLLAELYQTLPEVGDIEKPKFCMFLDEAHLMFSNASPALLDQIEMIIKLIRSKGVGIYFITQNPADIPSAILAQLGLKVQHALRAFTANDRKAIKVASENYPITEFYQVDEVITTLGMGEAFITALSEKGNPTPLVHVMMSAPETRMDTISDSELSSVVNCSSIKGKYDEVIQRDSALEILNKKIETATQNTQAQTGGNNNSGSNGDNQGGGIIESITENTIFKQVARTAASTITRSLLGAIFGKRR
jgi:uncharacterized protein